MLRRPRVRVDGPAPAAMPQLEPTMASSEASDPPADDEQTLSWGETLTDDGWLTHRGLCLHPLMRIVTVDGHPVELTRSEFDIVRLLMESGQRVLSKPALAQALRGDDIGLSFVSDSDARAIEVHVANLRRKLGESPAQPRWIETVRGVGYRLTPRA